MSYEQKPTRAQIEAVRGRFFVKQEPPYAEPVRVALRDLNPAEPVRVALRDLNPAERARVARNKAAVYAHLPELVPFIKELHEAGMIDGWRGVGEVVIGCVEETNISAGRV